MTLTLERARELNLDCFFYGTETQRTEHLAGVAEVTGRETFEFTETVCCGEHEFTLLVGAVTRRPRPHVVTIGG
jgi:hypothetical protein